MPPHFTYKCDVNVSHAGSSLLRVQVSALVFASTGRRYISIRLAFNQA